MHDRDALLLGCDAEPDNDLPRLVYADWLDDNDDPQRAEFIRLQCQRDTLTPLDPDGLLLELRMAELLHARLADWIAQAKENMSGNIHGFRRGFPVPVVTARLDALESLPAGVPLGGVVVSMQEEPEDTWASAGRAILRAFGFGDRSAAFWSSPVWQRVPWLRVESITDAAVGRMLARSEVLHNLRSLELVSSFAQVSGLDDEGVRELVNAPWLGGLQRLTIRDRTIGPEGIAALVDAPLLRNLTHLRLRLSRTGVHAAMAVAHSPDFHNLTSLDILSENWSDHRRCPLVEIVTHLGQLKHLRYHGPIGDRHLRMLSQSPGLRRFTAFELHGASNNDVPLILAQSPHLAQLRSLAVSSSWATPEEVEAIARSPHLTGLTKLDLSCNPVTDAGASVLAKGPSLSNLLYLDLSVCGIGDDGVRALARSPHLANLRYLNLSSNEITDDAVRAMAESEYLRSLRLLELWPNRHVTAAGAELLSRSPNLPHLIPWFDSTRHDVARCMSERPD